MDSELDSELEPTLASDTNESYWKQNSLLIDEPNELLLHTKEADSHFCPSPHQQSSNNNVGYQNDSHHQPASPLQELPSKAEVVDEPSSEPNGHEKPMEISKTPPSDSFQNHSPKSIIRDNLCELRLLVRRREAGALIGKRGSNIKRLRDSYRSCMLSIPDTGNGPERIACILADYKSMDSILSDISELLLEKSPEKDDQIELKLLIHSSQAGSIIGMGGQSIKKLRNESKAAIKIYELCCPYSNERVCAIKAKPPVVVTTIQLLQAILSDNPAKGPLKPYDASHFDPMLCDKYGGYLPEEPLEFLPGLGALPGPFNPATAMQAFSQLTEAAALQSTYQLAQQQHLAAAIDQTTRHNHYQRILYHQHQQQQQQQQHHQQVSNARAAESGEQGSRRKTATGDSSSLTEPASESEMIQQTPTSKAHPPRQQPRFHPYSADSRTPSIHQQVARFAPYERLMRMQPAFLHQHQQALSSLSQTPTPGTRCRHLRPCLCMLMAPSPLHTGLQPFNGNLINYKQPVSSRVPATTSIRDGEFFGSKKK